MGEHRTLCLQFRPNPFSVFGDQVSPHVHHERTTLKRSSKDMVYLYCTIFSRACHLAQRLTYTHHKQCPSKAKSEHLCRLCRHKNQRVAPAAAKTTLITAANRLSPVDADDSPRVRCAKYPEIPNIAPVPIMRHSRQSCSHAPHRLHPVP